MSGVVVDAFTFPFLHRVELGEFGGPLTMFALVLLMNIVNFSDGADGLAAGVCAIAALAFAIIAFDLGRRTAGTLADDHRRRRARLPDLQLPAGQDLHGGLRLRTCSGCCSAP